MTTQQRNLPANNHESIQGLIPWYVKGKLASNEHTEVEQHLADCEICQQEVLDCQGLAETAPKSKNTWKPSAVHFAGILAEVDKLEAKEKLELPISDVSKPGFVQRIVNLFAETPRPVRWTLAAESFAFAIIAVVMLLPGHLQPIKTGVFETLSNAETPASESSQRLRLVLSDDMTIKELNELLAKANSQIHQGPSAVGAYTIEIPSKKAAQELEILRTHPKVRLVLPVETASP